MIHSLSGAFSGIRKECASVTEETMRQTEATFFVSSWISARNGNNNAAQNQRFRIQPFPDVQRGICHKLLPAIRFGLTAFYIVICYDAGDRKDCTKKQLPKYRKRYRTMSFGFQRIPISQKRMKQEADDFCRQEPRCKLTIALELTLRIKLFCRQQIKKKGWSIMGKTVDMNGFIQICIVVSDIDLAAEKWALVLGIEKPAISTMKFEGGENYTYRGQPISGEALFALIPMNGFVLELQQPLGGDSTFHEFLKKHGNGVHHIGFETGKDRDAVIGHLKEIGFDTDRTLGIYPGSSWTIVDTEDDLGVNLNIKPVR